MMYNLINLLKKFSELHCFYGRSLYIYLIFIIIFCGLSFHCAKAESVDLLIVYTQRVEEKVFYDDAGLVERLLAGQDARTRERLRRVPGALELKTRRRSFSVKFLVENKMVYPILQENQILADEYRAGVQNFPARELKNCVVQITKVKVKDLDHLEDIQAQMKRDPVFAAKNRVVACDLQETDAEIQFRENRAPRVSRVEALKSAYVQNFLTVFGDELERIQNGMLKASGAKDVHINVMGVKKTLTFNESLATKAPDPKSELASSTPCGPAFGTPGSYVSCLNFWTSSTSVEKVANDFGADIVLLLTEAEVIGKYELGKIFDYQAPEEQYHEHHEGQEIIGPPETLYALVNYNSISEFVDDIDAFDDFYRQGNSPSNKGYPDTSIFHEIGHTLGGGHTGAAGSDLPGVEMHRPFAFGFRTSNTPLVATVMTGPGEAVGWAFVPLYSGQTSKIVTGSGAPTPTETTLGDALHDNAQAFRENAAVIASIRKNRTVEEPGCLNFDYVGQGVIPGLIDECRPAGCAETDKMGKCGHRFRPKKTTQVRTSKNDGVIGWGGGPFEASKDWQ